TVMINLAAGVFLAVLLNNRSLRFRNLYRTLLIVPWALPSVITIQVWKGFLNQNFGVINRLLALLDIGAEPINWLGHHLAAKGALLVVNLWLGLPYMMTATLGALAAIPDDVYEAARVDGANAWQSFWGVTGPLLRNALVPVTLSSFAFNFNNFNLIFLLNDGGPPVPWGTATARGTDILISWAYNEAFRSQGGYAYGLGSAITLIIFVITLAVSLMNFRVTGALKDEEASRGGAGGVSTSWRSPAAPPRRRWVSTGLSRPPPSRSSATGCSSCPEAGSASWASSSSPAAGWRAAPTSTASRRARCAPDATP